VAFIGVLVAWVGPYLKAGSDMKHLPLSSLAMRHCCCRCSKPFIIYNSGQYQTVEECVYHYGRLIKSRGRYLPPFHSSLPLPLPSRSSPLTSHMRTYTEYGEGVVSLYTCCQERRDSVGCQVAKVTIIKVLQFQNFLLHA